MTKPQKIFIIAGEVSGDVLGAKIMSAIGARAEFAGIGGEHMRAAGLRSIFPISDLAVMGIFEVLAHARTLMRRIDDAADAIIKFQPDVVLTIDSPSFAKRVIKKVKAALGTGHWAPESGTNNQCLMPSTQCRFYHVVAPQVWAWGPRRAKKFAKIFDRLYCFFDFEVPYFTKYGLETIPVGHPIADGLKPVGAHICAQSTGRKYAPLQKPQKNIALIPGSRMSEVKKLLPIMRDAAFQISNLKSQISNFYIPVVETTEKYIREQTADWCTKPELVPAKDRYELFAKTDIAIAASGTVTAELAIMHVPAIVVYKMNHLTEFLAKILVKTKWVSLVNILLKKTVYPELLGGNATSENIVREVIRLTAPAARKKMIAELSRADKMWRRGNSSPAQLIARDLGAVHKSFAPNAAS